jgi:protein TonB
MSYRNSLPIARKGGLLGIVIGVHMCIALLIYAAKTVAPQIIEMPLIVDLLNPRELKNQKEANPLPMAKPQPVKREHTPRLPAPLIEATHSDVPAVSAPVASLPDIKPASSAVGGETTTSARFDADYLHNPAPQYPPVSRRRGEEGKVILRVSVTPQGMADSVEIKTSSGSSRLDEAAANTVKHWKFIPAKRGDMSVQSWVLVPIIFKLEQ